MTKLSHGTRKYRPAPAYKVKLTKRNVKQLLSRNANVIPTRYGAALKRLAPMVSNVERLVEFNAAVMADLQADLSIYLGKIRDSCEKALEKLKDEEISNNNMMNNNKPSNNVTRNEAKKQKNTGVNDLLASFSSLKF